MLLGDTSPCVSPVSSAGLVRERNLIVYSFGVSLEYQEYLCTENVLWRIGIVFPSRTKGRHAHCLL